MLRKILTTCLVLTATLANSQVAYTPPINIGADIAEYYL